MIEFRPVRLTDKTQYEQFLFDGKEHGCDCSFANRYLWGNQNAAVIHGHMVLFSQFGKKATYPYPMGQGDKQPVLDAILFDANERGIDCRITGLDAAAKQTLEHCYPGRFQFHCDRDSFDYVYSIDDLADLKGRKYQRKRNHFNRFRSLNPAYTVEPLDRTNMHHAAHLIESWYQDKLAEDPQRDYRMEQAAIDKALRHYEQLGLEGLVLYCGDIVLAVTMGSRISEDTFDVHFEKAAEYADGAYAAINCEFARYIRSKYPEVRYLNREEDMGLEGLRKAKESYLPHHMVEKCWASLSVV